MMSNKRALLLTAVEIILIVATSIAIPLVVELIADSITVQTVSL
jgi:hypothetical protein